MIEVLFSDSAAGSLKFAMSYGKGKYIGGATSVIMLRDDGTPASDDEIAQTKAEFEAAERQKWEASTPFPGHPQDVFSFHLSLSLFDISSESFWDNRRKALCSLFSVYPDIGMDAARELLKNAQKSLTTLTSRLQSGEDMRVWYSSQPDELCGLYWLMTQLPRDYTGKIGLIKLPVWEDEGDRLIQHSSGWGEIAPEQFNRYLPLEATASPLLCHVLVQQWRELQKENAPLRACVNDHLVSVPESFYDHIIRRYIAQQDEIFHEARLIGEILGKAQLGIGDSLIALRIEEMLQKGELQIASDASSDGPSYRRMLKKVLQK